MITPSDLEKGEGEGESRSQAGVDFSAPVNKATEQPQPNRVEESHPVESGSQQTGRGNKADSLASPSKTDIGSDAVVDTQEAHDLFRCHVDIAYERLSFLIPEVQEVAPIDISAHQLNKQSHDKDKQNRTAIADAIPIVSCEGTSTIVETPVREPLTGSTKPSPPEGSSKPVQDGPSHRSVVTERGEPSAQKCGESTCGSTLESSSLEPRSSKEIEAATESSGLRTGRGRNRNSALKDASCQSDYCCYFFRKESVDSLQSSRCPCSDSASKPKKFGPKPTEAWDCARTRVATSFRGIEELKLTVFLPRFMRMDFQKQMFVRRYTNILQPLSSRAAAKWEYKSQGVGTYIAIWWTTVAFVSRMKGYEMTPVKTKSASAPPRGRYLVLSIFDDNGTLKDEVIIFTGGFQISKQLVQQRRRLFSLPILRDIKAFELYKCDQKNRTHVRVAVNSDGRDCLAALFRCVDRWERYYRLQTFLRLYGWVVLPFGIYGPGFFGMAITTLLIWRLLKIQRLRVKIINQPTEDEQIAWRKWIHENLNEEKDDPKESHYSFLCVVGWSRFNIVTFVVIPFCLLAFASIAFGITWSQDIQGHKGDVPGAWAISTFIITLAAGKYPSCYSYIEADK